MQRDTSFYRFTKEIIQQIVKNRFLQYNNIWVMKTSETYWKPEVSKQWITMSRNIFHISCIVTYLVMSTCTAYHKEPLQSNSLFSDVHVGSELANRYPNDFDNSMYQQAMIVSNRRPRSNKPTFKTGRHHHLLYLSFIIILQSADCKLNPGPRTPKYPCLVCTKAVRWNHRGIACPKIFKR